MEKIRDGPLGNFVEMDKEIIYEELFWLSKKIFEKKDKINNLRSFRFLANLKTRC